MPDHISGNHENCTHKHGEESKISLTDPGAIAALKKVLEVFAQQADKFSNGNACVVCT